MTTTDLGILLIVLCIVLWAIMAALHRHTVQLQTLQAQLKKLLDLQSARRHDGENDSGDPADVMDRPSNVASLSGRTNDSGARHSNQ